MNLAKVMPEDFTPCPAFPAILKVKTSCDIKQTFP